MTIRALRNAPQLRKVLREVPYQLVLNWLASLKHMPINQVITAFPTAAAASASTEALTAELARLSDDDQAFAEREARRLTRLNSMQADALHLRIASGNDFNCRHELEAQPGAMSRALWSAANNRALLRCVERAMQLRSYREHQAIYEAYGLEQPVNLTLSGLEADALEESIGEKLDLTGGCTIEAVELPQSETSGREIMVAVTAGGALQSQRTFAAQKQVDVIQFRPATELILVYKPDLGLIEVCGRGWQDRKSVATIFASDVLKEELSLRPLTQRNYDLAPLARNLAPEVPPELADRVTSLAIREARFALGSYDRKVTVSALPGEPIADMVSAVLRGISSRFGRPFLCDVDVYMRIVLPGRNEETLRFKVTNQNRSTLQSETDPAKRAIGFDLLTSLGVVSKVSDVTREDLGELMPSLLELLAIAPETITGAELRDLGANVARLTSLGFLNQKQIASEMVIDDDDLGPVEVTVQPDLEKNQAHLQLAGDAAISQTALDEVTSWTINRPFTRERILSELKPLKLNIHPDEVIPRVFALGTCLLDDIARPFFLWETSGDFGALERVDRALRQADNGTPGIVLVPGSRPIEYLGGHVVIALPDIFDDDRRTFDIARLKVQWDRARSRATISEGVEFIDNEDLAVLILPDQDPWSINGKARVTIVRKLFEAHLAGKPGLRTDALLDHTGSTALSAAFGRDWQTLIENRLIHRVGHGIWALNIDPT